jgi:hypothetical protein
MAEDFPLLPKPLRDKVTGLAAWLHSKGWEAPTLTCIRRTKGDQRRIYVPYAERLVSALARGTPLEPKEKALAVELAKMTPAQRVAWAEAKFSWHVALCAVDIRNRCYSRVQRREIMNHLRHGTNTTDWEILEHDVGRGDHFHAALRLADRRNAVRP